MLLPEEWQWLRSVTLAENVNRCGMEAQERTLLYCMAIQTGLRSSELRSLTRGRLFLDSERPYVTCAAGSTKNKRDCRQYINPDLVGELRVHLATKLPTARVFSMPSKHDVAGMLRADLDAARKAWLKAAEHDPEERQKREQSDFLAVANYDGEKLDFHALRHTCGAWLAMSGAHPKAIQTVMRHSAITLTMDTYGHLFPGQEAETVARLPKMVSNDPEVLRATGTCDAEPVDQPGCGQHFGQQLDGRRLLAMATGGESNPFTTTGPGTDPLAPQVLTLGRNKKSRRVLATPGSKAEGKGFEPSTGYPAPDFESGC